MVGSERNFRAALEVPREREASEPTPATAALDAQEALPLIEGISHLHEAVALLDWEGRIAWVSDALASAVDRSPSWWVGRGWCDLLADASKAESLARRMSVQGRLLDEAVTLRASNGGDVPVKVSAARLGSDGQPSATVAIVRLPAEPTCATREFRRTVDHLAAILDRAPDGVLVVDRSRFIVYANATLAAMTGHSVSEIENRPLALFLPSQADLDRIATALAHEGTLQAGSVELRRSDGRTLPVAVSASRIRLADGEEVGSVAYLRETTDLRDIEEDLARKKTELEHYVDAVSHDLRSPLVSLLGFSGLLREDYGEALDDKGRHFLQRIEEAGRTMESLLQDLLAFSRIGQTGWQDQWSDPREVLLQLKAELKPRLDARAIDLEIPGEPPLVRCSRTCLYRLLSNLIGNAVDHMGDRERPTIRVEITDGGETHRISVRDNGRGIAAEHHERIFEIFQSLSPRSDGRRGTGMGLAIVRKIAETQGGRAWVESRDGAGAAFHVVLPSR